VTAVAGAPRILVVNADDFGRTSGINRGVARAHEGGIVTSASLMVRYPAAVDAAAYARAHPGLALGLHVDLGEWRYDRGDWRAEYALDRSSAEIERQLEEFRRLVGADPTHLDSHQHVHLEEPVLSSMRELARSLRAPLRSLDVRYCGAFYGQTATGEPLPGAIAVDALVRLIGSLEPGITELGCHPGEADGLDSAYGREREQEVETLCDPRVRSAIAENGIELRSFRDAFD
jgi:predicted glycoside hydrolase/deacetylase ChbG (UPF0249 family)